MGKMAGFIVADHNTYRNRLSRAVRATRALRTQWNVRRYFAVARIHLQYQTPLTHQLLLDHGEHLLVVHLALFDLPFVRLH